MGKRDETQLIEVATGVTVWICDFCRAEVVVQKGDREFAPRPKEWITLGEMGDVTEERQRYEFCSYPCASQWCAQKSPQAVPA